MKGHAVVALSARTVHQPKPHSTRLNVQTGSSMCQWVGDCLLSQNLGQNLDYGRLTSRPGYLPAAEHKSIWLVWNHTTWLQRYKFVNNLPGVITYTNHHIRWYTLCLKKCATLLWW